VLLAVGVPALFVVAAVVRLALYTAYDVEDDATIGVQSTLAAVIVAAAVLAGASASAVLGGTVVLTYLMVASITYPDLLARDALAMGVIQALAVLVPEALDGVFPIALLAWAIAYLVLAPRFYWR
jgi:archaetidylserine synthase